MRAVGGLALVGSRVCAPRVLARTPTMYIVGVLPRRQLLTRHLVFVTVPPDSTRPRRHTMSRPHYPPGTPPRPSIPPSPPRPPSPPTTLPAFPEWTSASNRRWWRVLPARQTNITSSSPWMPCHGSIGSAPPPRKHPNLLCVPRSRTCSLPFVFSAKRTSLAPRSPPNYRSR